MQAVFKAVIGSHNYNLAIPGSDIDTLLFVLPTADDLYRNRWASRSVAGDEVDETRYDIRKVPSILWKSSPNALEALFSIEATALPAGGEEMQEIIERREEIARMNLARLYLTCRGMADRKQHSMLMDSLARHGSIERYGFDVKSACQSARNLDFILRMWESNFDFGRSIRYEEGDPMRERLIAIKSGAISCEECEDLLWELGEQADALKGNFLGMKPQEGMREWLDAKARAIFLRGLAQMGEERC